MSGGLLIAINRTLAPFCAILLCLTAAARADITKLLGSGPDSNRVKIVICAEGYTASQKQTFINDMNSVLSYAFGGGGLNADPYPRYHNFFNVYGLFMPSAQSGLGGYFSSYIFDGRGLAVDTNTVAGAVASQLPTANWTGVAVNTTTYCGGGYMPGPACFAAKNESTDEIFLHESGHSWHSLMDTYVSYSGAYAGGELPYVNVTNSPTGSKWSEWLGYNQPGVGTIGAYNGAYYESGVYSPSRNDKMMYLYAPFDAICREKIIQDVYSIVRPLDSYTNNSTTLANPASITVSPVDDSVINVNWTVDGHSFTPTSQDSLLVSTMGLSPGLHHITAVAADPTPWVRRGKGPLSQTVNWTLAISMPGDATGDGIVDVNDLNKALTNYNKSGMHWADADFDNDGVVTVADLNKVLTNYNKTSSASAADISAVAEPSTAVLLLVGAVSLLVYRRKRRAS